MVPFGRLYKILFQLGSYLSCSENLTGLLVKDTGPVVQNTEPTAQAIGPAVNDTGPILQDTWPNLDQAKNPKI